MTAGLVLNWLVRQAYPFGAVRRVRRGPARGCRFEVRPGMAFSYAWGRDASGVEYFKAHLGPGQTMFDLGANRGQMALIFAQLVGSDGKVVAVEPVPDVYTGLVRNVSLNRLAQVVPVHAAAADRTGELTFEFDPVHPTQGKLTDCERSYSNPYAGKITVPAVTVDCLAERYGRPDWMKVDVEGGAGLVFAGASQTLREQHTKLYVELHGPDEQAAVAALLRQGYQAHTLDGRPVPDPTATPVSPLVCTPGGG